MVKSLDQISKDLSKLETTTAEIDETIKSIYQDYLSVLGKAVKQQLVLAVYYLCTQAYPDEFLSLSVRQRERLQADVRKIAVQGQTQIEQLGQVMDVSSLADKLSEVVMADTDVDSEESTEAAVEKDSDLSDPAHGQAPEASLFPDEIGTLPLDHQETIDITNPVNASPDISSTPNIEDSEEREDDFTGASREATEMIRRLSTSLSLFSVLGTEPLSPVSLAKRHVLLERHIRAILRTLSSLTNYLLKQADILPDLPEMVLAAAIEAEAGESGPSTPNVLNVLVEIGGDRPDEATDDDDEKDDDFDEDLFADDNTEREMTHLVAINLRLADLEFADAHAALWRSKLQEILMKLKRLGSRYQKLQREKAKAEAEHAWRAIWFEE